MIEQKPIVYKKKGAGVVCEDEKADGKNVRTPNTAIAVGQLELAPIEDRSNKGLAASTDISGWCTDKKPTDEPTEPLGMEHNKPAEENSTESKEGKNEQ
jgi:hypothetical protein